MIFTRVFLKIKQRNRNGRFLGTTKKHFGKRLGEILALSKEILQSLLLQ